ncbi:hypothetical protein HY572_02165 [Candidatus Micrarchaeota archaeon]|nr:hypothetical protein [Candidatus Micrarchaeota archaeon]
MRQGFSAIVIMLLFVELLSPLAFAADPPGTTGSGSTASSSGPSTSSPASTGASPPSGSSPAGTTTAASPTRASTSPPPSAGGACAIDSISDAERQQLQQFLFSSKGRFQGDFLNDLPLLESLTRTEDPVDPFSEEGKKRRDEELKNSINASEVAKLYGIKEEEFGRDLKIWDADKKWFKNGAMISGKAALDALSRNPKSFEATSYQEIIRQIQEATEGVLDKEKQEEKEKKAASDVEPYARFKIIQPSSGKEFSLSEYFTLNEIDPTSCLLRNEIIQGRVGYVAMLDADLTYGTRNEQVLSGQYVSPATGKPTKELQSERGGRPVNQYFVGSKVIGYLNLNGGGNLVVPEFYRDWITFAHAYTRTDFYISAVAALGTLGAARNLRSVKEDLEKSVDRVKIREAGEFTMSDVGSQILGDIQRTTQGNLILREGINIPNPAGAAPGVLRATSVNVVHDPAAGGRVLRYFDDTGTPILHADVPGVNTLDEAITVDRRLRFERQGGLDEQIRDADHNLRSLRQLQESLTRRVTASYMLAGGWLGPARMAFMSNSGILFQARHQDDDKFLRVLANKQVLEDFKKASGFLALGKIQEFVAKYAGLGLVPEKAFYSKDVLLINYPEGGKADNEESQTSFRTTDEEIGSFGINSVWKGDSYTLNFEDLRGFGGKETFTSLAFVSNNIMLEPVLEDQNLKSLTAFASLAVPFWVSKRIFDLQEGALGIGVFLTTLEYLDINENYGKDATCGQEEMDLFKNKFRAATAGSVAITALNVGRVAISRMNEFLHQTSILNNYASGFLEILDWTNPAEQYRFVVGNNAITYTSNCRDPMHNILTFQPIPERAAKAGNILQEKVPALYEQIDKLPLGKALQADEEDRKIAAQLKNTREVLNLRTQLANQQGQVLTPELLYVHVTQSTFSTKHGLFNLIQDACSLPDRVQSKDGRSITFSNGLQAFNADGSTAFSFQSEMWKLRAMARNRNQALARVIIPNKIIQQTLSGSDSVFLDVSSTGQSTLVSPSCDLARAYFELSGRNIGSDFTQAIGKVKSVITTDGEAGILDNQITFVDRDGFSSSVPSPEDLRKSITSGGRITIHNNGQVMLHGAPGGSFDKKPIGTLESVVGEFGLIEHEPGTGRLLVIIYSLFETSAQNLNAYKVQQKDGGVGVQTVAKAGLEESADKLNKALESVAGKEGFTSFETADKIFYITPDGNLRVIDKKTGTAKDYKLKDPSNPVKVDGNEFVIPTDKGDFRFSIDNQNGQPTLNAQGPDGLQEVLALLAARGQNGVLTFNPSTGAINVYNGQDVPLNPAFADQGIGFTGAGDGSSQGTVADNPFLDPRKTTESASSRSSALALPSWPQEGLLFAVLLLAILVGVAFVRFRGD